MAYDLSLLLDPFLVILTTFRLQSVEKSVKMQAFLVHRNNQKLRDKRYKWKHSCVKLLVRQPSCIYRFNWYSLTLPLIVSYVDNDNKSYKKILLVYNLNKNKQIRVNFLT